MLYNTQQTDQMTQDIRYDNFYGLNVSVVPHGDVGRRTSVKEGHCLQRLHREVSTVVTVHPSW